MATIEVHYYKTCARFNLLSNEKQWQIVLHVSATGKNITVSELFDEEDEPEIDGFLPSDVISVLRERTNSYWIKSGKEELLEKYDKISLMQPAVDAAWIRSKIDACERTLKTYHEQLKDLDDGGAQC